TFVSGALGFFASVLSIYLLSPFKVYNNYLNYSIKTLIYCVFFQYYRRILLDIAFKMRRRAKKGRCPVLAAILRKSMQDFLHRASIVHQFSGNEAGHGTRSKAITPQSAEFASTYADMCMFLP
ncbi:MAG: hypothetical protein IKA23_00720, partial [Akkermansia sp.]|nr:hypothetical protein [Akkermansia sp.]